MANGGILPSGLIFPTDDDDEDAEWLASLIQAVRIYADQAGHEEVVAILDEALTAAVSAKPKGEPH